MWRGLWFCHTILNMKEIFPHQHIIRTIVTVAVFAEVYILTACEKKYAEEERKIVINEIMPVNTTTATDQDGEYDDWIELCNISSERQDISGWLLSDSKSEPAKYRFPPKTIINGNGFLIIWVDADTMQNGLHAGFKLSAEGEKVILSYPDGDKVDLVEYPPSSLELSYSRNPDGRGSFRWQLPTFSGSNNTDSR